MEPEKHTGKYWLLRPNCLKEGKDNPRFNNGFTITKAGRAYVYTRQKRAIAWARIVYQHYRLGGMPIPAGFVVHHIDRDIANDSPDNLMLLYGGRHTAYHHKNKAVKMNAYFRKKCISVEIERDGQVESFVSMHDAAKHIGVSRTSVMKALRQKRAVKGWNVAGI